MKELKYILVCGYGWSGSGAVVDLLKEFKGYIGPNIEFRLIRDRFGVRDLEFNLTEGWDMLNADLAIKDFLWFAKTLGHIRQKHTFDTGLSYEKLIGKEFITATEEYVASFIKNEYKSWWHYFSFRRSRIERAFGKLLQCLHVCPLEETLYLTEKISKSQFYDLTKQYMDNIFIPYAEKNDSTTILLDQAVPPHLPECGLDYFRNSKVIVVDRDPRDIYAELVAYKVMIGKDMSKKDDAEKYITWFNALRKNKKIIDSNPDILSLRFEDVILSYSESVEKIMNYIGEKKENHIEERKFFNPVFSKKNIGKWKNYPNRKVMDEIKEALLEFCFDE